MLQARFERACSLKENDLFKELFEETRQNLTTDIESHREKLIQLQGQLEHPPIGFHVYYVKDLILDTRNEILIFEKTFINEGTGYDTSTGIFTAPAGGLYQFVVHTCAYKGKHAYIGLVLEGNTIATDANFGDSSYGCNTVGAITRVRSGEQVWVKSTSYSSDYRLFQDYHRMNTFSGMFINK